MRLAIENRNLIFIILWKKAFSQNYSSTEQKSVTIDALRVDSEREKHQGIYLFISYFLFINFNFL